MLFVLDGSDSTPLFEQLANQVRLGIIRGDLIEGERLPSARELARSLDINSNTVLRAYQLLRDEGLIELRQGRGATVTKHGVDGLLQLKEALTAVRDQAAQLGIPSSAVAALVIDGA